MSLSQPHTAFLFVPHCFVLLSCELAPLLPHRHRSVSLCAACQSFLPSSSLSLPPSLSFIHLSTVSVTCVYRVLCAAVYLLLRCAVPVRLSLPLPSHSQRHASTQVDRTHPTRPKGHGSATQQLHERDRSAVSEREKEGEGRRSEQSGERRGAEGRGTSREGEAHSVSDVRCSTRLDSSAHRTARAAEERGTSR